VKQTLETLSKSTTSYVIEPQIPSSYVKNLLEFIHRNFLLVQRERFTDVSIESSINESSLSYTVVDSSGKHKLKVQISGGKPLKMSITSLNEEVSEQEIARAKEDVDVVIDFFEEQVRKNTLFFAWREGESIMPERLKGGENKSLRRMFLETQILLMILFMGFGLVLFYLVGPLMPIILLAIQFIFVFYSNKLIARTSDWHITKSNPIIHLLEYPLPLEEHDAFREKITKDELIKLKKEIYEKTISKRGEIDCQEAHQILTRYGIDCKPENMMTRKVNVYETVKNVADKFGFPMPEIVVSNTMLPNAAASGPSPSRGIVLITTGLFVQLKDNEITSVLGHEFGHLKGRDPLWLYGLSAAQYLLWFYLIFGLFPVSSLFLFFIYFWGMMTFIYFIAKFFEARADLTSAMVVGQPKILADALEKIGFKRLLYERSPLFRIQEWISMDPHPPIYFRIARLRKLGDRIKIKHPLIQSAREVTIGFLHSFS
jgi:heat shock protein HtpX